VVYYHPSGRKSYETNYVDGKKNGFATVWYPSGQKQWQTTFKGGKTHGRWREWYPDGKKKFEADYNEGRLDGRATWWHDNGRIWQERSYNSGVQVKGAVKEWDKAGRQTYPPPERPSGGLDSRQGPPQAVPPSTSSKLESPG
jgi:antitoxin component YwqK of YwqJK toxin-antitoxin module